MFVAAGASIVISGLALLWRFPHAYSPAISAARLVFGLGLGAALVLGMRAILRREVAGHRAWMIRAYGLGIGATAVTTVFFPIYLATGAPPSGATADAAFLGAWTACVVLAEAVARRGTPRASAGSPNAASATPAR